MRAAPADPSCHAGLTADGRFVRSEPGLTHPLGVPHEGIALPAGEIARRRELTRANPAWHARRRETFDKLGELYAASHHASLEQSAHGALAFERGECDRAATHYLQAALLEPPLRRAKEVPPPLRETK